MSNFENLKVWHRAIELAVSVYKATESNKSLKQDFGLRDQMRRSSVSISSNISEGDELGSDKQAVKHFFIFSYYQVVRPDSIVLVLCP